MEKNTRLDELFRKLKQASPDSTALEQGFEQRVLQRLTRRSRTPERRQQHFYTLAWRAVPVCALISLAVFLFSAALAPKPSVLALIENESTLLFLAMY